MDIKEYDKVLKIAQLNRKKFNYRTQVIKCCATCQKSRQYSIEDTRECSEINPDDRWNLGSVDDLDICDHYCALSQNILGIDEGGWDEYNILLQ